MHDSHASPPHQVDSTSTRLLARLRRNEPEAWREFVLVYGPVVRYWIRRASLQGADLADVFQDTFLAVSRNIEGFEREDGHARLRAWLKRVTHSKVVDHFRRKAQQPEAAGGSTAQLRLAEIEATVGAAGNEDQDAALAHSEDVFLAQRTLHMVKHEFRDNTWRAFQLTALEDLTSEQAAAELGITALAVRKAKSRVMQRLKQALAGTEQSNQTDDYATLPPTEGR